MNTIPKYYSVCDESIYIVLRCFVENTFSKADELHPCLTKESQCETKQHVVKYGYVNVLNMNVTITKNVFWTNPKITNKGLQFIEDHSRFSTIYEYGIAAKCQP